MNRLEKPVKSSHKLKSIRVQMMFTRKPEILTLFPQTSRSRQRTRTNSLGKNEKSLLKYFYLKQKF